MKATKYRNWLVWGLGVTQGHQQLHSHSIEHTGLPIRLYIETMRLSCTVFELLSLISQNLQTLRDRDQAHSRPKGQFVIPMLGADTGRRMSWMHPPPAYNIFCTWKISPIYEPQSKLVTSCVSQASGTGCVPSDQVSWNCGRGVAACRLLSSICGVINALTNRGSG